jgi:hypothetical protein
MVAKSASAFDITPRKDSTMSIKYGKLLKISILALIFVVSISRGSINVLASGVLKPVSLFRAQDEAVDTTNSATSFMDMGIAQGAHLRPVGGMGAYGREIADFNNLVGKDMAVLMYFTPWSTFDPYLLDQIREGLSADRHPAIMLSWEPGNSSNGCDLGYNGGPGPLTSIVSGRCDSYIRSFARALKSRPERFLIRFAHEMNITDTPWWPGHYGQDASAYVAMWRHVHSIFEAEGVSNVEWVWSVNYASNPADQWNDLHNYYPGDDCVDWIGLSGYNWYTGGRPTQPWRDFHYLYDSVLQDLACHYAKPQIIAEFGSVDGSSSPCTKADWISEAYSAMPNHPFLRAAIWFNDYAFANPNYADFRLTTSSGQNGYVGQLPSGSGEWTQAYRNAIADPIYRATLPSLEEATPGFTYCGEGDMFSLAPLVEILEPGNDSQHSLVAYAPGEYNISLSLPSGVGITGSVSPATLSPSSSVSIDIATSSKTPLGDYEISVDVEGVQNFRIQLYVRENISYVYLPLVTE